MREHDKTDYICRIKKCMERFVAAFLVVQNPVDLKSRIINLCGSCTAFNSVRFDKPRDRNAVLLEVGDEVLVLFRATVSTPQDWYTAKVAGVFSTKEEATGKKKKLAAHFKEKKPRASATQRHRSMRSVVNQIASASSGKIELLNTKVCFS